MKSREASKIHKTRIQNNKNLNIQLNLTEPNSNIDTNERRSTQTGNQISPTYKYIQQINNRNQKSSFVSKQFKKINISKLNISEFENFSSTKSNFNQSQENSKTNKNNFITQTKISPDNPKNFKFNLNANGKNIKDNLDKTKATPSSERLNIIQQQNKSKLVDKRIIEKKTQIEIHNLMNEQSKLKRSLEKTKDHLALGLISKKILEINQRVKKLMNNIKLANKEECKIELHQEKESKNDFMAFSNSVKSKNHLNVLSPKNKNKIQISNCISYRNDWTNLNKKKIRRNSNNKLELDRTSLTLSSKEFESKENIILNEEKAKFQKMMDDNLKVEHILLQSRLLEQKKKFSQNQKSDYTNVVKYPNFFFLRTSQKGDNQNLYKPTTNISNGVNLFKKSYRPKGFTTRGRETIRNDETTMNNRNGFDKINLRNSKKFLQAFYLNFNPQLTMPNPKRNIQDIIEENDKNNNLINNKQIIYALRNKKQKPRTAFITSTEMCIKPNDSISDVESRPHSASEILSNSIPKFSINLKMKNLRKIYAQVIADHKIIQKGVVSHYKLKKRKYKDSDYDNLLKLWEMNQLKDDLKNLRNRRDHNEKKKDYLKSFGGADRKFFEEVYEQMNYENRILNKLNGYETNPEENKVAQLRMHREFKKIARETMFMKKEKIDDHDSDIKKQFEHHYANFDQLQWLVKKKKILKNVKSRFLNRLYE